MIRERKGKKDISGNSAFIIVILLSISIIFLSSMVGYIENKFGINYLENIIYVFLIVVAYFLIKNYLTEFRYSFFDDEFIVEKILGKKIIPIASIKIREVEYFGKLSDIDLSSKDIIVDNCDVYKKDAYAIKYLRNGERKAITISPSEELIIHIKKSLEARDYDEVEEEKILK